MRCPRSEKAGTFPAKFRDSRARSDVWLDETFTSRNVTMLNEWHGIWSSIFCAALRGFEKMFAFRSPVERVLGKHSAPLELQ
jgi:hypothetical protein